MKFELEFFDKVGDSEDFAEIMMTAEIVGVSEHHKEGEIYFKGQIIGRWKII